MKEDFPPNGLMMENKTLKLLFNLKPDQLEVGDIIEEVNGPLHGTQSLVSPYEVISFKKFDSHIVLELRNIVSDHEFIQDCGNNQDGVTYNIRRRS